VIDLGQRFPDRQVGSNHEPIAVVMVRFGVPLDLSGASVTFSARSCESGVLKVDAAAGSGAANGVAQYAPTLADLDTAGIYHCQFVATYGDGTVHRTPIIELRLLPNA
jgi:hypothetical protein